MRGPLRKLIGDISAATAVEYALLLGCVFLAIVVSVTNLSASLSSMWNNVSVKVNTAN